MSASLVVLLRGLGPDDWHRQTVAGPWIVRDLGSTNGVKVNGRRIQDPQSLKRGDVIELGTARVTFDVE